MPKRLINLTKQPMVFLDHQNNPIMTLPPSEEHPCATISVSSVLDEHADCENGVSIPIFKISYKEPTTLPKKQKDTLYVVSSLYRTHNPREDLVSPGRLIRDSKGNVIGTISLSR